MISLLLLSNKTQFNSMYIFVIIEVSMVTIGEKRMLNKKSLFMYFGIILISFSIVTFIGGTEPSTTMNEKETNEEERTIYNQRDFQSANILEISVFLDEIQLQLLKEFNIKYEKSHSGVNIRLNSYNKEQAYDKYKQASQVGAASDIMLLDNDWINEFAANGYLIQLDEIMNSMNIEYHNLLRHQTKWNGSDWAVPIDSDIYVWVWNPEQLEKKDVLKPDRLENLLEFMVLYPEKVYVDQNDPYSLLQIISMLNTSQKQRSSVESEHLKIQLDIISKLAAAENSWESIKNGDILFKLTTLKDFYNHGNDEFEYAPIYLETEFMNASPVGGGVIKGSSFVVSSNTKVQKEAFEWLQTLLLDSYYSKIFINNNRVDDIQLEVLKALKPNPNLPDQLSRFIQDLNQLNHEGQMNFLEQHSDLWTSQWMGYDQN
ncbi:extracellular solute-binding protein [Chengkuizengella sp. YPA3-1-1]|uniref:Extracellular solute-binding protein n=2 Tax=Chengkuizengella marina TaxID=2507566 RepID=A0A6N9Q3M6_9BACL|nr:extracellular solute-binding protein [Chengkuizengella marina]